jgi:hypothetical protein
LDYSEARCLIGYTACVLLIWSTDARHRDPRQDITNFGRGKQCIVERWNATWLAAGGDCTAPRQQVASETSLQRLPTVVPGVFCSLLQTLRLSVFFQTQICFAELSFFATAHK